MLTRLWALRICIVLAPLSCGAVLYLQFRAAWWTANRGTNWRLVLNENHLPIILIVEGFALIGFTTVFWLMIWQHQELMKSSKLGITSLYSEGEVWPPPPKRPPLP